jgi:hypothetical protein
MSGSGRVATHLTENVNAIMVTHATIIQDIYSCSIRLLNATELYLRFRQISSLYLYFVNAVY